jgi:hypothetical protein
MLPKLELYGIVFLILSLGAAAAGLYERHEGRVEGRKEVQDKWDQETAQLKAAAADAKITQLEREKGYVTQVSLAVSARDAALAGLRAAQASAASRTASGSNPQAPAGSSYVCYDAPAFNAAFQQFGRQLDGFIQATRGIVAEGDAAAIDARSLIQGWPK